MNKKMKAAFVRGVELAKAERLGGESDHEASGAHMAHKSPRADELIACLEGEIAKRDETIARLEPQLNRAIQDNYDLRTDLSAIKAQEPVGYAVVYDDTGIYVGGVIYSEHDHAFNEYMTHTAGDCSLVTLYAAPVPEAKAHGVVMLGRDAIREVFMRNGFTIKEGQADLKPYVYAAAEELLRLAAPVQQVSVPDGWRLVPVEPTPEMMAAAIRCYGNDDDCYRAMLAAAPAAPAADAGLVEALEDLLEVYSKPDQGLCCSGKDCGCMGATIYSQAEHCARAAIAAHRAATAPGGE